MASDAPQKRLVQFTVELPNFVDSESSRSGNDRIYKDKDVILPWGGEVIYLDGEPVGYSTSSCYSFSLEKGVFVAYVKHPEVFKKGWVKARKSQFSVELFGQKYPATASLQGSFDPKNERVFA